MMQELKIHMLEAIFKFTAIPNLQLQQIQMSPIIIFILYGQFPRGIEYLCDK